MQKLSVDEYILQRKVRTFAPNESALDFPSLCEKIKESFFLDWENRESSGLTLEIQKRAIIGYEKEKSYFINRINELIRDFNAERTDFPEWYSDLTDAVYQENWGLAGMAQWFSERYSKSSSAKIVGEDIFFMQNGSMTLMPQKIDERRKEQLIKAFMLFTPEERLGRSYYELYLLDGTRVTVFTEPMAKKGRSAIVFRRYLIPELSFDEQAARKTIPKSVIPMFKAMVAIGYNVVFMGAVRTAKTTFLSTWMSYEDKTLEGVMVETDPEIPLHKILPGAPVLQLIADGEELKAISKNLLRSDADYFVMAEARDGIALDTALRIACKGTKRMKLTFHSRNPKTFPLEAAVEIVKQTGGDINLTMRQIALNFDYLFHFVQLKDKSQKRLMSISELSLSDDGKICVKEFMKYIPEKNLWKFSYEMSAGKRFYGIESDETQLNFFLSEVQRLNEQEFIS